MGDNKNKQTKKRINGYKYIKNKINRTLHLKCPTYVLHDVMHN